jgi:hypothetical protein
MKSIAIKIYNMERRLKSHWKMALADRQEEVRFLGMSSVKGLEFEENRLAKLAQNREARYLDNILSRLQARNSFLAFGHRNKYINNRLTRDYK